MNRQQNNDISWWDRCVTAPQYLIPHHFLSLMMHKLTQSKVKWIKNGLIRFIAKQYKVNVSEAVQTDLSAYESFNAFFTRQLKPGTHSIEGDSDTAVSPVDGAISQLGRIESGQVFQAKGHYYNTLELLGGDAVLASLFEGGHFATIYLSPRDYHRIHMPLAGRLQQMRYIPGQLFSVSPRTARTVPRLFARNERVVTVFDTEQGPMVLILVGAIFVGSMETVWAGQITPPYKTGMKHWEYGEDEVSLEKGQEMGRFNMGSTVIILLPEQAKSFLSTWQAESVIRLGQALN